MESHRRHRRHRDAPQPSTCLPGRLLATWRTLRAHPLHFPPWNPLPRLSRANSAKTRAPRSSPPWKPVATFLLSRCHLVQDARRRRLHRRVQAIEARSPEHVVLFTEPPLDPQPRRLRFAVVKPSPPPSTAPLHSPHLGERFPSPSQPPIALYPTPPWEPWLLAAGVLASRRP